MPTGKNKNKKKKQPRKTKRVENAAQHTLKPAGENGEKNAKKRVAAMREKLRKSMEDPEMRDQIVHAIRTMINNS